MQGQLLPDIGTGPLKANRFKENLSLLQFALLLTLAYRLCRGKSGFVPLWKGSCRSIGELAVVLHHPVPAHGSELARKLTQRCAEFKPQPVPGNSPRTRALFCVAHEPMAQRQNFCLEIPLESPHVSEACDRKCPVTTHQISLSRFPIRQSIARFVALRQRHRIDKDSGSSTKDAVKRLKIRCWIDLTGTKRIVGRAAIS